VAKVFKVTESTDSWTHTANVLFFFFPFFLIKRLFFKEMFHEAYSVSSISKLKKKVDYLME